MYPEVRAAVAADTGPDFRAPGFDLAAHREEVRLASLELPREEVGEVEDVDADGVPCRLYVPTGARDGLVVHLHGGGFVFNDVDVHDGFSRRLANRCGRRVLSVDYRRPPEHRVSRRARRRRHGPGVAGPAGPAGSLGRPRRLRRRQPRAGRRAPAPRPVRGRGPRLPVPRAARRPPVVRRGRGQRLRPRARRAGTGSSTPTSRPGTTPTSPRCAPTASRRCRRPWSPPPSTTRSGTRARSWPAGSPRRASRPSASGASGRPTASTGTTPSPRPNRS